jgi:hypothetical protein
VAPAWKPQALGFTPQRTRCFKFTRNTRRRERSANVERARRERGLTSPPPRGAAGESSPSSGPPSMPVSLLEEGPTDCGSAAKAASTSTSTPLAAPYAAATRTRSRRRAEKHAGDNSTARGMLSEALAPRNSRVDLGGGGIPPGFAFQDHAFAFGSDMAASAAAAEGATTLPPNGEAVGAYVDVPMPPQVDCGAAPGAGAPSIVPAAPKAAAVAAIAAVAVALADEPPASSAAVAAASAAPPPPKDPSVPAPVREGAPNASAAASPLYTMKRSRA